MANRYRGTNIVGLLGVLFVGLKLTGYIDWSWWFVLMPFYIPLILCSLVFVGVIAVLAMTNKK